MKRVILLCLVAVSLIYAKDTIKLKEANSATKREYPTNQTVILSYNNILKNVRTSLVNISTQKRLDGVGKYINPLMENPLFRDFFRGFNNGQNIPPIPDRIQRSLGSGVIISSDGYIVTNNHVVDGADKIKVSIAGDKKEYEATLIGRDAKSDIAIVKIDAQNLNAVTFFDSDKVKVGDVVFALGNPYGVGETITQGIVSATGRSGVGIVEYEDFIQTDASINPGNSGGALINSAGQLIGINSAIISQSGGNVGIGFAIPSNMVKSIAKELINNGKYSRAYLGVNISDVSDDMSHFYDNHFGALITSVEKNTPAQRAGLKRGDLIIAVDDKKIQSASELKNAIGSCQPSKTVSIKLLRDKKTKTIKVKLASLEKDSPAGKLNYKGMHVTPLSTNIIKQLMLSANISGGVLVQNVDANSEALRVGIMKNDIIVQIENQEIHNIDDFKKATATKDKKRVYIYRDGILLAVVL